jgi:hypothetical protein
LALAIDALDRPMLRTTVQANERTDLNAVARRLRDDGERAGLAPATVDLLIAQAIEVLAPLISQSKQLSHSGGTTLAVSRELTGEGFSVKLAFGFREKRGVLKKAWDAMWGNR